MLDPKVKEKMQAGYAKIGDIGYQIALNLRKGKDSISRQKDLWERGIKIWQITKLLYRHIDITTTPVTLKGITARRVNRLLFCLEKLGNLDVIPALPTIIGGKRPEVINKGVDGADGAPGKDGSNADILILPEEGEGDVSIRQETVGTQKRYYLSVDVYTPPSLEVVITAPKMYMIGQVVPLKNISITTQRGNKEITGVHVANPSEYDVVFQSLLNYSTINNPDNQPVINTLPLENLDETVEFDFTVTDGVEIVTVSDKIEFFYPFLHGSTPSASFEPFGSLIKTVHGKANLYFDFDDEDAYYTMGYPSSYGEAIVRDEHGDVVTDEFVTYLEEVTSVGLDQNWTEEYRFYRLKFATDITGRLQLEFS